MKKVVKIVIIIVLLLFIGIGFIVGTTMVKQNKQIANLEFSNIDMNTVSDGIYEGISETELVKVTVEVTMENHKITNIDIVRHDNGKGSKAEEIVNSMVANNTYEVDAVSGATISSSVIKNAVNKALVKGVE